MRGWRHPLEVCALPPSFNFNTKEKEKGIKAVETEKKIPHSVLEIVLKLIPVWNRFSAIFPCSFLGG